MEVRVLLLLVVALAYHGTEANFDGKSMAERIYKYKVTDDMQCSDRRVCGSPLILTPLIKAGKTAEARNMSKVAPLAGLPSYAAFLTTDEKFRNNMYFWYWPVQAPKKPEEVPLLIWLQGGPGGSSLFGLFEENGPIQINANMQAEKRDITWNKNYNMLYIDNPVGAGFSFTGSGYGYANNSHHDVAINLYTMIQQFYEVFPELLTVDLYITGESYGGHYVPSFAYWVHTHQPTQNTPPQKDGHLTLNKYLPLKGIAIGDGWIDPLTQIPEYPNVLKYFSLADKRETALAQDYVDSILALIRAGQPTQAFDVWDEMLNGDIYKFPTFFYNITGTLDYDAFVPTPHSTQYGPWEEWVTNPKNRPVIHVGDSPFASGRPCEMHLLADFMSTLKPQLATLMDNYKVLLYNGQVDVIVGVALTENMIPTIPWKYQSEWKDITKKIWYIDPKKDKLNPAGYIRQSHNFIQAVVRDCGHLVPHGQPARAFDMISKFVDGRPF